MLRRMTILLVLIGGLLFSSAPLLAINPSPEHEMSEVILPQGGNLEVATNPATGITESSALLNGFLTSLGPYNEVEVWFSCDGRTTPAQIMRAPGPFSYRIGGLAPGTQHSFNAVASSNLIGGQTSNGSTLGFTTIHTIPRAPIAVTTGGASDITSSTAVLHGYLDSMGPYSGVTVWFEYGTTASYGAKTSQQTLFNPGPFSIQVSGLLPNTGYYFRAVAFPPTIGVAAVYGNQELFVTPGATDLDVNTGAPTSVTATSATIVGYLQSLGSYRSAYVWFEWGPTVSYGQTTPMQTLYAAGAFSATLQNLNPGTTYNYRAMAVPAVSGGTTVHGLNGTFTTTYAPGIKVSTGTASNIGPDSATLNGILTSMGINSRVTVWFEYGTDTTLGSSTAQQILDMPGSFSYNIRGLHPGITYYYRAAASAAGNNFYGSYSTFQLTAPSPVTLYTNPASSISSNTATLNANVGSMGSVRALRIYFNYGKGNQLSTTTPAQTITSPGSVSYQLTDLTAGTEYSFQAVAETSEGGKIYGGIESFTTVSTSRISVTTSPATGVTSTTAILNGVLDDMGNASRVQVWFEYGTTADFGNSSDVQSMDRPGTFSSVITGLAPQKTYYYRSVALNPTAGSRSITGPASMFTTSSGAAPSPEPSTGTPIFIWFIMGGFIVIIIILTILLASRR